MLEFATRDAVEHRAVWIGAFLITAVTSMFTSVCCHAIFLGVFGPDSAFLEPHARDGLLKTAPNLLFLSGAPAILVLTMVLNTLVTQTRRTHSQWRLAGASPQQVVRIFSLQVIVVSACGAPVGAVVAIPFWGIASQLLGRGLVMASQPPPEIVVALNVLASVLVVSVWGILAGIKPAIWASRTSPLIGQEPDAVPQENSRPLRRFFAFLFLVQMPLLVPFFVAPTLESDPRLQSALESRSGGMVGVASLVLLPASWALVITVSLLAPYYLSFLIRGWTCIPGLLRWTPWRIARHMAVTRAGQSTATVIPLMIGVGLFASFNIVTTVTMNAQGAPVNMFDGILMLTPIGVIGAVGSAAVVFMASRQRSQDLTALRIAGASPTSSVAVFVSEAVIYAVTALLIALVPTACTLLLLSTSAARWQASIDLSGVDLTGSVAVMLLGGLATVAIMVMSGLSAWRRPLATYLINE